MNLMFSRLDRPVVIAATRATSTDRVRSLRDLACMALRRQVNSFSNLFSPPPACHLIASLSSVFSPLAHFLSFFPPGLWDAILSFLGCCRRQGVRGWLPPDQFQCPTWVADCLNFGVPQALLRPQPVDELAVMGVTLSYAGCDDAFVDRVVALFRLC